VFLFKICEKMFASGVSCSNFLKLMCIEHKLVFFFSYVFPSLSVVLFALDVNLYSSSRMCFLVYLLFCLHLMLTCILLLVCVS